VRCILFVPGVARVLCATEEIRLAATTFAGVDARRAFLEKLIDDAGLFPPAQLSMADALAANARARTGPHAWMLGRFVVPASRLDELAEQRAGATDVFPVSVILDGDRTASVAVVRQHMRSESQTFFVESLEVKLPPVATASAEERFRNLELFAATTPHGVALYIELDLGPHAAFDADVAALTRANGMLCAKIRCGGPAAADVPSPALLAHVIKRLVDSGSRFKATAGLHHPLRGRKAEAGFAMHGFLNVIGAAVLANTRGLAEGALEEMIADESAENFRLDAEHFRWKGAVVDAREVAHARERTIRSYGSCSFDEPVDDLIALGILRRSGL